MQAVRNIHHVSMPLPFCLGTRHICELMFHLLWQMLLDTPIHTVLPLP